MSKASRATLCAYVIMQRGDEAFFLHRLNTTYQLGKYMLPGSSVEKGEPVTAAGVRETMEEVGVSIQATDLKPAYSMYRPTHDETGE
jgi:8-oxo-dGTP pyrophosphatase MutT (NUDIX family)